MEAKKQKRTLACVAGENARLHRQWSASTDYAERVRLEALIAALDEEGCRLRDARSGRGYRLSDDVEAIECACGQAEKRARERLSLRAEAQELLSESEASGSLDTGAAVELLERLAGE